MQTALACLAAHTLYDEGAQPAVRASTGSLTEQDDGGREAELGGSDPDEDAASFRTAEGDSDEAAALGHQVDCCAHSCLACPCKHLKAPEAGLRTPLMSPVMVRAFPHQRSLGDVNLGSESSPSHVGAPPVHTRYGLTAQP